MKTSHRVIFLLVLNLAWFGICPALYTFFELISAGNPDHDTIVIPMMSWIFILVTLGSVFNIASFVILGMKIPTKLSIGGKPVYLIKPIKVFATFGAVAFSLIVGGFVIELFTEIRRPALMMAPSAIIGITLVWIMRASVLRRMLSVEPRKDE